MNRKCILLAFCSFAYIPLAQAQIMSAHTKDFDPNAPLFVGAPRPSTPQPSTPVPEKKPVDIAKLRESAEKGDHGAQLELFSRYCKGDGVAKDDAEADKWLNMAADAAAKANEGKPAPMSGWGIPNRRGCNIEEVQ